MNFINFKIKAYSNLLIDTNKSNNFFFLLNNFFYEKNYLNIKNNFLIYLLTNKYNFNFYFNKYKLIHIYKKTAGHGYFYLKNLFIIFFLDASFSDDEPIWEPLE